jgi:hypothetical protein
MPGGGEKIWERVNPPQAIEHLLRKEVHLVTMPLSMRGPVLFSLVDPGDAAMTTSEFQVQKAGLVGDGWKTVCRASEAQAREIFQRQLRLYSIGRFRLVDPNGKIVEEKKAVPLFSNN